MDFSLLFDYPVCFSFIIITYYICIGDIEREEILGADYSSICHVFRDC